MITLAEKLLLATNKSKPYVEFVSSTVMNITPKYTNSGVTLQYSLNGTSWTNISSGSTTSNASIIYFRGSATGTKSLFTNDTNENKWVFNGASNLMVVGNLNYLLCNFLGATQTPTTLGNYCYSSMFSGSSVASVDVNLLPATTLTSNSYYKMFQSCSQLIVPPSLPAINLGGACYAEMFSYSAINTLPKLPALTLQPSCYYQMFTLCSSIKVSTTMTGIYDTAYRIPTTGMGTTASNWGDQIFAGTGGTFTGTPSINTTYYTENTPV